MGKSQIKSQIFHANESVTRMPNVMVALPNLGGALCSTPQSLADAHYYVFLFFFKCLMFICYVDDFIFLY